MKNTNLLFLFLALFLASCQKNQDVIEIDKETTVTTEVSLIDSFSWRASVIDAESVMHFRDSYKSLHDVSVKLMSRGAVIAQTNTNDWGTFELFATSVPEDAYVLFESIGYHNSVVKVNEEFMGWQLNMVRNTYPGITREITSKQEPHIALTGRLHELFRERDMMFFVTNNNDELVGTATLLGDLDHFYITTIPDEELFLHYSYRCFPETVIPLGSFSEDTDIMEVLNDYQPFTTDRGRIHFTSINNCAGNMIFGNDLYYKVNGLTKGGFGNTIVDIQDCFLPQPILVTAVTENPRKYQETTITLSSGTDYIETGIDICEEDDTFIHYSIGASGTQSEHFTFANILPDGRLVIKQLGPNIIDDTNLSFVTNNSTLGNSKGDVLFYIQWSSTLGGKELDFNITKNDGEFVEGNITGEIFDIEEISQGNFEATFRARIQ